MVTSKNSVQMVVNLLPQEEREALKSIAAGRIGNVSTAHIGKLKSLYLIHHNGRGIELTLNGREVLALC